MKTKLSVAAMALLLASCSSNDNDLLPENPVNATPIQVSQSVQGMVKTRAAVGARIVSHMMEKGADKIRPEIVAMIQGAAPPAKE